MPTKKDNLVMIDKKVFWGRLKDIEKQTGVYHVWVREEIINSFSRALRAATLRMKKEGKK